MAEATLLFAGDNVWSQELDRKKKYYIHGILMTLSASLITAGVIIEIHNKGDAEHFTSIHGVTGEKIKNNL